MGAGKTPFLRLLLPVIAGIVAGSIFPAVLSAILPIGATGLLLMLLSFFVPSKDQFGLRWLFGAGVCIFLFSLPLYQFRKHAESVTPPASGFAQYDLATVREIPEVKPRSIAITVKTAPPEGKKLILYLEQTDEAKGLLPGDEIVFRSTIAPFRNFGNPDDFDYEGYMRNKGFAGSGYVSGYDWQKTGRQMKSIPIISQRFRAKALEFYRSFGMESDAYAFICALTLGYKLHLSNDLQEAFRVSGTSHILALSGLHVGIIYAVITFLFSFPCRNKYGLLIRQLLILAALWAFVFMVGMSASIVRAAVMLTLFSLGNLFHRNGFSYNSLAAAAFFILVFQPFHLFDVGFQMSFGAVFAILFFVPKLNRLCQPQNKIVKYVWDILCVTTAAQLGVFPLVLYYFGTFPTWFFITNLLVVPFTGIIICATLPLIVFGLLRFFQWDFITPLYTFFQWVEKILIESLLRIVYISESIPFAQISNKNISFPQLVLLLLFVYLFAWFLSSRRARPLLYSLVALLFFQCTITHKILTRTGPQLTVFNTPGQSEIAVLYDDKRHFLEFPENGFLPHPEQRIILLSDTVLSAYQARQPLALDVLILSRQGSFDIGQLQGLFRPSIIVLDSSLPRIAAGRITRECIGLGITVHDTAKKGAFSLKY